MEEVRVTKEKDHEKKETSHAQTTTPLRSRVRTTTRKYRTPKSCPRLPTKGKRKTEPPTAPTKRLRVSRTSVADITMATENRGAAAKKADRSSDPFEKIKEYMDHQFKNTNENIASISGGLVELKNQVQENTENLAAFKTAAKNTAEGNAKEMEALYKVVGEKDIARREDIRRLEGAVNELMTKDRKDQSEVTTTVRMEIERELKNIRATNDRAPTANPSPRGRATDRDAAYWKSRRSLKLWPVPGSTTSELWRGCETFLNENMAYPVHNIRDQDVEEILRCPPGNALSRVKDEILVVFASVAVRDSVSAHAKNLKSFVDSEGRPTAGQRIDIPDFLRGVHRDLETYGKNLRKAHGPGLKRNIKFDDQDQSLVMDVKLPDEDEWVRVDRQLAYEERRSSDRSNADVTRKRLGSSTGSYSDVEMASTQSAPTATGANTVPVSETLRAFGARPPGTWGSKR